MGIPGRPQPRPNIGGAIAYWGLEEWWLSSFTDQERQHIEDRFSPMGATERNPLSHGPAKPWSHTGTEFLNTLAGWFDRKEDRVIAQRIRAKMAALAVEDPVQGPGFYHGRHFTTYTNDVKELKRDGDLIAAERLLLGIIGAAEEEALVQQWDPPPGWYNDLAIIYRKRKDFAAEIAILQRYLDHSQDPRVDHTDMLRRMEKARVLQGSAAP